MSLILIVGWLVYTVPEHSGVEGETFQEIIGPADEYRFPRDFLFRDGLPPRPSKTDQDAVSCWRLGNYWYCNTMPCEGRCSSKTPRP